MQESITSNFRVNKETNRKFGGKWTMEFNYGLEKKKFDKKWEKLREEYRKAGMSEEAIQKIWEFDWNEFKRERAFCKHNQYFTTTSSEIGEVDESMNPLILKYEEKFIVSACEVYSEKRYSWIDEIDNSELYNVLHELKDSDIELLTMLAFEGYSVVEISKVQGVSHQAISKKISRLKNILKNFQIGVAD